MNETAQVWRREGRENYERKECFLARNYFIAASNFTLPWFAVKLIIM